MHLKNKITIVIPTLNRPISLSKSLDYYSKLPFTVKYFDGSKIKNKKFKNLPPHIKYFHLPNLSFFSRIKKSLSTISTPYVILGCDDEFYTLGGLISCFNCLEKNKKYISSIGQCVKFYTKTNKIITYLGYEKNLFNSVKSSKSEDRVKEHLQEYAPKYIYSLSRAIFWKKAFTNMLNLNLPVFAIGELVFEISMAFQGKIKILRKLFWFRNYDNSPHYNTEAYLNPENKITTWWNEKKKKKERNFFIYRFSKLLNSKNKKKTSKLIWDVINAYCNNKEVIKAIDAKNVNFFNRVLSAIKFRLNFFSIIKNDQLSLEKLLKENKIKFLSKEIKLIYKLIKN